MISYPYQNNWRFFYAMGCTWKFKKLWCFSEIKKYGVIEWRQGKYNIHENDIVYIYLSKPEGYVAFKCIVEAVNIRRSELKIDDGKYFLNDTLKPVNRYMRLRPIKQYSSEDITFEKWKMQVCQLFKVRELQHRDF